MIIFAYKNPNQIKLLITDFWAKLTSFVLNRESQRDWFSDISFKTSAIFSDARRRVQKAPLFRHQIMRQWHIFQSLYEVYKVLGCDHCRLAFNISELHCPFPDGAFPWGKYMFDLRNARNLAVVTTLS
jgi:hypothetical protein